MFSRLKRSQIDTENDQKQKTSRLLTFLFNFCPIFDRLRELEFFETLTMALLRCPVAVGFSREVIAVFPMKQSQIDTENDENPKICQFSILRIFRQFFDRIRGLECFKGSTGRLFVQ